MGASSSVIDQRQLFEACVEEYEHGHNVADDPELFERMQDLYDAWFRSVKLRENVLFCEITEFEWNLDQAFKSGQTPLILDTSFDDKIRTFFSYQPDVLIFEAKSLIIQTSSSSLMESLDNARKHLVNAMKHGKTLVIHLGTTAPDFTHQYNDDSVPTPTNSLGVQSSFFPSEVFHQAGRLLREDQWAERLFKEEDMFPHKNFAVCRDEFKVCLLSKCPLENVDEYLFGQKPIIPHILHAFNPPDGRESLNSKEIDLDNEKEQESDKETENETENEGQNENETENEEFQNQLELEGLELDSNNKFDKNKEDILIIERNKMNLEPINQQKLEIAENIEIEYHGMLPPKKLFKIISIIKEEDDSTPIDGLTHYRSHDSTFHSN